MNKFYDIKPEKAISLIRKWGNIKIDSKTLRESLTYDNLSFWDIIEYNFISLIFEHHYKPKSHIEPYLRRYLNNIKQYQRKLIAKRHKFGSNKNKILIFPPIETTIPLITPVIKELQKNPKNDILVLRLGTLRERMKKELKKQQIKNTPLEAYLTRDIIKRSKKIEKKINGVWKQIKNNKKFQNSIKYNGICVWDLVKDSFSYYFSTRKRISEVIIYTEIMGNILDIEKPDIVVTVDECSELAKPTAILAKSKNIPSIGIQHSIFERYQYMSGPLPQTKLILWGQFAKKIYNERGVPINKMIVTGTPTFDKLKNKNKFTKNRKKICKDLGLNENKGIITFMSQPLATSKIESLARIVFKAMNSFPNKQLVIKLHPAEYTEKMYGGLKKEFNLKNVIVTKKPILYDLLASSDLMVMGVSTTGLEAMILGCPVISMDLTNKSNPYLESGGAIGVHNSNELKKAINKILKDSKARKILKNNGKKYVKKHIGKIDGNASKRIVKIIEKSIS